ncbi:MAG: glycosyltransferase family 2 protein [Muribaculaceae bacterium]|nr:glycosyltransferase family 2 protein [Muribaculaceae bacterium]
MDLNLTNRKVADGRKERPTVAFVVPCYNENQVLRQSLPLLLGALDDMAGAGIASSDSFVLCVDDGSKDDTWQIIAAMHRADKRIKAIRLSHNRGQQNALLAGLMTVRPLADAAITIDADLQDSLEAAAEMVALYREGFDIVYGVRASRKSDSFFKRTSARAFYNLQNRMGLETIYDHSEFRLMSRRALDILAEYPERNLYLRGIMPAIGLRHATVSYDRSPRLAGETKYSFMKLLSLSIDAITSFSARPMRLIFLIGLILLVADIGVAIWVFMSHFAGRAMSGWSSLMLSVWFLGSLMLISLGIIGEYIGKIFNEVKRRPRYSIQDELLN